MKKNNTLFALLTALILTACNSGGSVNYPIPNPTPPMPTPGTNWTAMPSPTNLAGRANDLGLATDQYNNMYLSYQTESNLSVYRYAFNQVNPSWKQISTSLPASPHSPYSSLVVSKTNDIFVSYTGANFEPSFNKALPDKENWSATTVITNSFPYTPSTPSAIGCALVSPYSLTASGSYVSMAVYSDDVPLIAYQDNTNFAGNSVNDPLATESGVICTASPYSGNKQLTIGMNGAPVWEKISSGSVNQVKMASTPNDGNSLPIMVAYQDADNNSSITVQQLTSISGTWSLVGLAGISGKKADFISLALDSNGVPYIAYEDAGNYNRITVQRYVAGVWQTIAGGNLVGNQLSVGNATYISIAVDPINNTPYVAYQDAGENGNIYVQQFNDLTSTWAIVGSSITGIPNNYGLYTSLAIRPNPTAPSQAGAPAIAFQITAQTSPLSTVGVMYYNQ